MIELCGLEPSVKVREVGCQFEKRAAGFMYSALGVNANACFSFSLRRNVALACQ